MAVDVKTLVSELTYDDWKTRQEALRQLENAGDAKNVADVVDRLQNDESMYVRIAAARTLGKIGDAKAAKALIAVVQEGDNFILRQTAVWALAEIGAPAKDALPLLEQMEGDSYIYTQGEMTVGKLAGTAKAMIEIAIEEANKPADEEGSESEEKSGKLTPEERKAKREAALARKRAQAAGEEVPDAPAAKPKLTPEERQAKREAALARKRAKEQGEG